MVDYSKWNNIDVSDDEDDDDIAPKVTKFDKAGKFHIGPQGSTFFDNDDDFNRFQSNSSSSCSSSSNSGMKSKVEEVDVDILTTWSKNGSLLDRYIWGQNKNDVIIRYEYYHLLILVIILIHLHRVALDNIVKAADIKVSLEGKILNITSKSNQDILSGTLSYEVIRNQEDEDALDWEIISIKPQNFKLSGIINFTRFMEITLKKKSPFSDATIWWSRVFENDPEIDVSTISDRRVNSTFQDNWNEAHKLFKEKIAKNIKTTIELDEDSNDT